MRKHEAIDLMKLYSMGSANGWNEFLQECFDKQDINKLAKVLYQVQAGEDDLAKRKLNTDEMNVWTTRLKMSIEKTAKKIIKLRNPMPGDRVLIAKDYSDGHLEAKRLRDRELAKFIRDSSY